MIEARMIHVTNHSLLRLWPIGSPQDDRTVFLAGGTHVSHWLHYGQEWTVLPPYRGKCGELYHPHSCL